MKDEDILYHGTSRRYWKKSSGLFFVTTELEEAKEYAWHTAETDENDGFNPNPIVVILTFKSIKTLSLLPDNPSNYKHIQNWGDSLKQYGSFAVEGLSEDLKQSFPFFDANQLSAKELEKLKT